MMNRCLDIKPSHMLTEGNTKTSIDKWLQDGATLKQVLLKKSFLYDVINTIQLLHSWDSKSAPCQPQHQGSKRDRELPQSWNCSAPGAPQELGTE